jgi:hypothetical protein
MMTDILAVRAFSNHALDCVQQVIFVNLWSYILESYSFQYDIYTVNLIIFYYCLEWTQKFENYMVVDGNFKVEIVNEDDDKKTVALNEHYVVWKESLCHPAYLLDPAEEKYFFLSNGSLKISHFEGELESLLPFSEYCLMKDVSISQLLLFF